jgi:hypothetical protein
MNWTRHIAAILALAPALVAGAQQMRAASPTATGDASWVKVYATTCRPAFRVCAPSTDGYENAFNSDPRFSPLLRSAFPQRQWFWLDGGKFTSVPNLIQLFLGVPGSALVDQDRYFTANGCIPHDCVNRGMLWIDTAPHPAQLIFIANDEISGDGKGPDQILWIFSSSQLNWQKLSRPFLDSFHRWHSNLVQQDRNYTWSDLNSFLVANLVQPNGEIVTLSPSVLGLQTQSTGATQ